MQEVSIEQDLNEVLLQQATKALEALQNDNNDKAAAYDMFIIVYNGKSYSVNLFSADVCGMVEDLLTEIMQYATDELNGQEAWHV